MNNLFETCESGVSIRSDLSPDDIINFPNFKEVVDEYRTANVNPYVTTITDETFSYYRTAHANGIMKVCAAVENEKLIGFGTFLLNRVPHYDGLFGTFESIFVLKDYRKKHIGNMLLEAMFNLAREYECQGMYIGAGVDTTFAKVCAKKFKKVNEVFYKPLWEMKL